MYMLSGPPFKKSGDTVVDRSGEAVQLMGDSAAIMHELVTSPDFEGVNVVCAAAVMLGHHLALRTQVSQRLHTGKYRLTPAVGASSVPCGLWCFARVERESFSSCRRMCPGRSTRVGRRSA